MEANPVTFFAETTWRNEQKRFGIYKEDRRYHMAIVGKPGTGKSTLMETLIRNDSDGNGFGLLDPHGDLAERVLKLVSEANRRDLVNFSPTIPELRLGFNMLDNPGVEPHLIVSSVISVFKKIWAPDFWGPRMEHIFRNALWILVSTVGTTLADIPRVLLDRDYRRQLLKSVSDGPVKDFWFREFEKYPPMFREEAIAPILNKIGAFLSNPYIRDVISQPKSSFNIRKIMDEGGIFVASLDKGRIGEDASRLLGSMLATQFELAALSRADIMEEERQDFYLYIDEFPAVVTPSFATVLAESRKYRLNLILAMQYIEQLEESLRHAVFENAGNLIAFRVGPESARILAREFQPEFNEADLMSLPRYHISLRMMVNGVVSRPFSGRTIK